MNLYELDSAMDVNETKPALALKPCPFCGSEPVMRHGARSGHWVQCDNCGAGHPYTFDTEAEAIATWNRRATEAQTSTVLVDAVRAMRSAQREWFQTKNFPALDKAKKMEKAVDALLREIDTYGQPKQGELL